MNYKIYTDGSCLGNPGKGGYALVIVKDGSIVETFKTSHEDTTNNRMELMAIIEAIKTCIEEDIFECKIYSDSQYAINGILNWMDRWAKTGWLAYNKKPIRNLDLWEEIYIIWNKAKQSRHISIHYVRGHHTNAHNILADKLAKEAAYGQNTDQ